MLLLSSEVPQVSHAGTKPPLNIGPHSDYLCYYGPWDDETIFRAQDFSLVILEPSNVTATQINRLKRGHDGLAGTGDDVIVIGYLSVGEDHLGNRPGNGCGPCYYSYDSARIVYENKGYASWYVDDADHNNLPDADPVWKSAYVNAGDSLWWNFLKTNSNGADTILTGKGCDGLFLDLLDVAMPWSPWPYRWSVGGMSDLVAWLRSTYPGKFLIGNRGLFYFDPATPAAYSRTIRPYVDAVMFESYWLESDRSAWAHKLNIEAAKPDGFRVIALDYFAPTDTASVRAQFQEVTANGWTDYVSSVALNAIHYEVFHSHIPDTNPPTWNSSIGLVSAVAGDALVTLHWGSLQDQSPPFRFDLYYTKDAGFNPLEAVKVPSISPSFDSSSMRYSYTLGGLTNHSRYEFVVRASDASGNAEHNLVMRAATPPNVSSRPAILIDGHFSDWGGVPLLTAPPNPPLSRIDSLPVDADFTGLWATSDSANLYVSYKLAGNLTSAYFYHVFIDADATSGTGYRMNDSAATGADLMVEGAYLYAYNGTGGTNWSWIPAQGLSKGDSAGRTELKIPRSVLRPASADGTLRLLFNINAATPPYGFVEAQPANFGTHYYSYTLAVPLSVTQVQGIPAGFRLRQNYPNPFNPSTTLRWQQPISGRVRLVVSDVLGREVAVLADGTFGPGEHTATFSAAGLATGCYFARLSTPLGMLTTKMLLAK
jgi:hypothetical protein